MQNQPQRQQRQQLQQAQLDLLNLSKSKRNREVEELPPIPDKLYFTIGEASKLCLVKPYVLRYWQEEFPKLNPVTRRGNRRYYQRDDILLIRLIKDLLYRQGFTIEGARAKLNNSSSIENNSGFAATTKIIKEAITQLNQILADLD